MERIKVLIMGAAGRDFHDFNTRFRDDASREVVAFTATQIPYIQGRIYPPELAGPLYPSGITIHDESLLTEIIRRERVRSVYFSYSDVGYEYVMGRAALVQSAGASFVLPDPFAAMLRAEKPVISVCAVRTGCGKSQTCRHVAGLLQQRGLRVAVVRHPMPYGDLVKQRCQRFETLADLERHDCTIEEMEEYEPHLTRGFVVYAGVDYGEILAAAQQEAEVILWDGGNNDLPFFASDLHIVVADPHRVGHERLYYPGEVNVRLADVFVINKEDSAAPGDVQTLGQSLRELNPRADVVHADSLLSVDDEAAIAGKRVLCIEDGPTLTHGEMAYGAAVIAAERFGAAEIVDPRPWLEGTLAQTFAKYPAIGPLLPAMGYSDEQFRDLAQTIARVDCDLVLVGTPIDLTRQMPIDKPMQRVRYSLKEKGEPSLTTLVGRFLDGRKLGC
ncbi:MAG: GTPase [Deltaproteobacteria bacterium]|nr:GTPase [Deltaproteobacteria bacterium]